MADRDDGRRSPPTARVVTLLDHLVAHPDQRFGLSELARRTGVSKPTCLGILTELVDAGYVARSGPDKTYGLGPALVVAGRAAQRSGAVGRLAGPYLEPLVARFGAVCTASAVVGDRITVLEMVAPDSVDRAAVAERIGQVYPFAPPVGLMYVLWDGDDALRAWLGRTPTLPVRIDRDHVDDVVARCRRDGYLVELATPGGRRLHRLMAGVVAHELSDDLRELLGELASELGERVWLGDDDAGSQWVNLIAAPVFDDRGRQSMVLTAYVDAELTPDEIAVRGEALARAGGSVSVRLGGPSGD